MKNNKKAIIVDDELHARAAIKGIIKENFQRIKIVGEAKDLPEGIKLIHEHQPDIVFLDIEMPGYSGLEILDFFPKNAIDFHIIFVTAYNEFALRAFELSAIDYLIKPIQIEHIERALHKISKVNHEHIENLRHNLNPELENKIVINTSGGQVFIELNQILYIKADGSYSNIVMKNNERYYVTKKLIEFEKLQELGPFLRIHRSQMININHIQKILRNDGGSIVMSDGAELSISQEKKQILENMVSRNKI